MIINILEYLEQAQEKYAEKVLYKDETQEITFGEALSLSRKWGGNLAQQTQVRKPVLVITDKTIITPLLYFAVLYSGCYYVPIDTELPKYRIKLIMDTVQADIMLTDSSHMDIAGQFDFNGRIISTEELSKTEYDPKKLDSIRAQAMDVDPAYAVSYTHLTLPTICSV